MVPLRVGEERIDGSDEIVRGVNRDVFHRLVNLAVDRARDHLGFANGQLEAFATHRLDENGELEFAATLDFPGVGAVGGSTRSATLPTSSLSRRSFTMRAVSSLPRCPRAVRC